MTSTITAELARRLQRKSIIVMVTALVLWLTVMTPPEATWSWQWWARIVLGASLTVTFFAAAQDFMYARRVLAEEREPTAEAIPE